MEFLGCLIAIVGGAWLGALYLGIDVQRLARAMIHPDALDKMPPDGRPAGDGGAVTREQIVTALREELQSLRADISRLRTGETPTANRSAVENALPASGASATKSLAYWRRMDEIVRGEAELQQDTQSALTEANAAQVFAVKSRVSRFAVKAVKAIPSDDVDTAVLQFGQELAQWYDRGGVLYERAAQIWELPPGQRPELTRRWQRADLHHRNEARLLGDKSTALGRLLSRRFNVEFPGLAEPARASGGQNSEDPAGEN